MSAGSLDCALEDGLGQRVMAVHMAVPGQLDKKRNKKIVLSLVIENIILVTKVQHFCGKLLNTASYHETELYTVPLLLLYD
jgi:hypothetical protein